MSTDDFEPYEDEFDEDDGYEYEESSSSESIKDKYDRYKEKYDNYQKKRGNKSGTSNDLPQPNNDEFRKSVNKVRDDQLRNQATKGGTQTVAKEGTKTVAKEAGKEVAKEGTKTVAKEGAKVAAKEGAKVAAEAGAASTGVGIVVAAAIEAADKLAKKIKALKDKELREQEEKKAKKRRIILIVIICFVLLIFIPGFIAGPILIVSDESTALLEEIIKKREERNTENLKAQTDTSGITKKTLMMFTDDEYRDLLFTNYDEIEDSDPIEYEDPSYNATIKSDFGSDIINFFANQEDLKDKDEYEVATNVVGEIIEAEKENFNKINWSVASGNGLYSYTQLRTFSSLDEMNTYDVRPSYSGNLISNEISEDDMQKIPYTELEIPSLSKYNIDPETSNETQKAYTYAHAVENYVQNWYIPYTMMIDTQDKKFIVNEVMEKMYHPIDFTLYEINRERKITTTEYYLETTKKLVWDEYVINEVTTYTDIEVKEPAESNTTKPGNNPYTSGGTNNSNSLSSSNETTKTITRSSKKETKSEVQHKTEALGISNTRDSKVGEEAQPNKSSRTVERTYRDSKGRVVRRVIRVKENYRIVTELTGGGKIATDENGPMVRSINVNRSIYPYRYIPKVTHVEAFYEVIDASYNIVPIDETTSPRTSEESGLTVNSDSTYGIVVLTETWDESLSTGTYESKPYQVSYYSEADLARLNKKVSRVEWYQDWGDTSAVQEAVDTGNTFGDWGGGEPSSENMRLLLEQAFLMVNTDRWVYGQGGDRGISYTLEQLYNKRNIDCTSFVISLYNIFLGVSVGSYTGDMPDAVKRPGSGLIMEPINGNYSQLQVGDILWRRANGKGHVGLYVGNGKQIDAGGPTGTREPNYGDVSSSYTHFIRYVGVDLSDVETPNAGELLEGGGIDIDSDTKSELSTEKGIIYPYKTMSERIEAYETYGEGKGYSYDDMYFAYYQIESRLLNATNQNGSGTNDTFGGFAWPVEITESNPGTNVINCFYGYTPAYGETHSGIDISRGNVLEIDGLLSKGPNIVAAHDGTVTRATANPTSDSDGYTYVNIQTTDGAYTTQYGHLSEIYVKAR